MCIRDRNGNQSTFIRENIIFENGYLILCLTDDENIGYQDQEKPILLWARASGDSIIAQFSEELDPESSQNENNFSVSGASIVSAELMSNLRTVKLKVTDMSLEENHSLIIFGIEDDNDPPNIQMAQSIQVDMPQPISFPLLINNAGVEVDVYEADQLWSSSVEYGHMNGNYQFTEHLSLIHI